MTAPGNGNEGTNSGTENNGTTATGTSEERNTDFDHLSREDLEKALRSARDDAGKYRTRAKEFADDETYNRAKEAVTKLDEIEQAKKSEVEKLSEKNAQLLSSAANNELTLAKYKAAVTAGIPADQIDAFANRLQGTNAEEIKADAEELAKLFKTNVRVGDRSQGQGNEGAGAGTEDAQIRQLFGLG